jgi:hypothetical protein
MSAPHSQKPRRRPHRSPPPTWRAPQTRPPTGGYSIPFSVAIRARRLAPHLIPPRHHLPACRARARAAHHDGRRREMHPPGRGKSRLARRPVAPSGPQPDTTNTRTSSRRHRMITTPPIVSITDDLAGLQDRTVELAHLAAFRAWASGRADWTRAASHLNQAAHHMWLAAEALSATGSEAVA